MSKLYHVPTPDYLILTDQVTAVDGKETYEEYRDAFLQFHGAIPEGVTETFIHPALPTDELKSITGTWQRRGWEYELMKDPATYRFFESCNIQLISYRDLVKMRA